MDTVTKTSGAANAPTRARRLIGPKDLPAKGIVYHLNHLRRLWQRGDFPAPIYTSARRFAWPEDVIDSWIDERIAASSKARR
jgi:hypothetical protein